ncbi:MAG: DNA recombination protein RmuC [Saprospiraceae bacterium]
MELPILFLLIGLIAGGLIGWLIARLQQKSVLSAAEIAERYVARELYVNVQMQLEQLQQQFQLRDEENRDLSNQLRSQEQITLNLEEKLRSQREEVATLQEQSRIQFENIANRLLEEKSQKFTLQNRTQLNDVLSPLREKIKEFEDGLHRKFREESHDRISLKEEIKHLRSLNEQLSQDANNLAAALKGDNKTQGDWGEYQLEMLLTKAGLTKDVHFRTQNSFRNREGKQQRPDFIINLPEEKHLVIDSKVSLVAYDKYFNAETPELQKRYLQQHLRSVRQHVQDLSSKRYQDLYQINSPDYLLLFIPIEPAFALCTQQDAKLFDDALDKNIVIVTTSTLLATLRTVSYIWKQEKQKKSVLEIARQSGLLYDKLVGFVTDLQQVGQRLDATQATYHAAMNKLQTSTKYGDTVLGRAEKIRQLGARTSKRLPKELLAESIYVEQQIGQKKEDSDSLEESEP